MFTGSFVEIKIIVTIIIAIIGWIIGHKLNSDRDQKNKQRELRIEYLINAYNTFLELGRTSDLLANSTEIEKSVNHIQLFGTPKQIELCDKFVSDITQPGCGNANHTELVIELRNFIRGELGLKIVSNELTLLKIEPK